jgi:hypothetical protein
MKPIAMAVCCAFTLLWIAGAARTARAQDWTPAKGRLMTRWAKDVRPRRRCRSTRGRRWCASSGRT